MPLRQGLSTRRQLLDDRETDPAGREQPGYCKDSGKIEYLRLAGYLGKIAHFGGITWSPVTT